MSKHVDYKGVLLGHNSEAYQIYQEAQKKPELWAKLDQHMKMLEVKNQELMKRYDRKEKQ